MMHGYGFGNYADWMGQPGSFLGMTGWMVIPVMGFGLLLVIALVAWFVWAQRHTLGLAGPQNHPAPMGEFMSSQPPMGAAPAPSAESIAAERFARGEIDAEQYREIVSTLRQQ